LFEPARFLVVVFYLGLTLVVLRHLRIGVAAEAAVAASRAIIQLLIMGSLLMAVFRVDSRLLDGLVLSAMVLAAAVIASRRGSAKGGFLIAFTAVFSASALVILPMTVLGVFDRVSSFLIPISGMVIGNAMNTTALSLDRLQREMETGRKGVEALLALGIDVEEATRAAVKQSVSAALIPSLNAMKSVGIVHIPGLMTGMLLSGADPIFAAEMQAIIIYLIFVGAVLSSLVATRLHRRTFFTPFGAFRKSGGGP
jgi:putative ABC transport system permease protein